MDKRIHNELSNLRNIILDTVPVKHMFLFGSYVDGIPHVDSDLDIYVVISDNTDIREIDAIKLIRKAIRNRKTLSVDVVVSKESKFNRRKSAPTIERRIVQEGLVLYG